MSGLPTSTERPDGRSTELNSTTQAEKARTVFREVDRALRALESMPPARRKQTVKDLLLINEELSELTAKLLSNDQ